MPGTPSARIHDQLDHPVIDADGHMIEFLPVLFDYLKDTGGTDMVQRLWGSFNKEKAHDWYETSHDVRRHYGVMRPAFWALPAENTVDRATAILPRLMRERLPEMGIDYSIVYPTTSLSLPDLPEEDLRRAACRAHNLMLADMFRGCEDRLTPAAVVPCHTPAEAIEELDFAIGELGLKVPMFGNLVRRPLAPVAELDPSLAPYSFWVDTLAIDSLHDYDPVWQRCMDLGVPVTSHGIAQGIGMHRSISNYMYNQTGHFAAAAHAFAKSVFFGGVTHRFPKLNFAFLECGVAVGAALLCDLKERWEKRNGAAVHQFDPTRIDRRQFGELLEEYGGEVFAGRDAASEILRNPDTEDTIDDFALTGIETINDLYDRLIPRYYWGCEADDRMNITGFDTKLLPSGTKLNAIFSSDIGHWDVPQMREVLAEAHELVEEELLEADDFRDFVFTNPVSLYTAMNPDFFNGTAVESQVSALLEAA
jgi:predicted TIM-barrel fold metal-dependent hydrolase